MRTLCISRPRLVSENSRQAGMPVRLWGAKRMPAAREGAPLADLSLAFAESFVPLTPNSEVELAGRAAARGAHAAGVPFSAARRKPRTTHFYGRRRKLDRGHEGLGGPPNPARGPRALPISISEFGLTSSRDRRSWRWDATVGRTAWVPGFSTSEFGLNTPRVFPTRTSALDSRGATREGGAHSPRHVAHC